MPILCPACGADWEAGAYGAACTTCGGGALERPCPLCGGRCGVLWRRAVLDSIDAAESHWVGACRGASGEPAGTSDLGGAEWWLDESALPDLIWAALVDDGSAVRIVDNGGQTHRFSNRADAELWLREDEYERLADLQADGRVPSDLRP